MSGPTGFPSALQTSGATRFGRKAHAATFHLAFITQRHMKHLYTLPTIAFPAVLAAQSLVSTSPQPRTVLLEDFTGVNCQYCPEGHTIMETIETATPDQVVLLGIHAGGFAVPSGSQPDFRTPWGNAMNSFFAVSAYPSGVINRHTFPSPMGLAMGRGYWESAAQEMLAAPSPVNLGMASTYNAATREVSITVEVLYTANSPGGNDFVNVVIKESGITGPQASTSGNIPSYTHDHVVRGAVTPTWGDEVTTTTAGSFHTLTYTYTLPDTWVAANCDVVAFIGENQSDVYQAREVAVDGGTTLVIGELTNDGALHAGATSGAGAGFDMELTNTFGSATDFTVSLTTLSAPSDWTGSFTVNGTTHTAPATITLADGASTAIDVDITPGSTAGIGRYKLEVSSVAVPQAPVLSRTVNVIAGVTDLVVSNTDVQAVNAQPRYMTGLQNAGNTGFAAMDRNEFIRFGQAGALAGVINIYRNVSWTFPSLVDDEVALLQTMLDGGVNMMIAGQDIGWDQSGDANAYGTPATQSFYTNYLLASFVSDGTPSNAPFNFIDADEVFGALPNSNMNNAFGSSAYNYPDEFTPIAPAVAIMNYGSTNKIGGLRAQTANYKLVYMGVGPEQFTTAAVGTEVVTLSHHWFYGTVGIAEFDAALGGLGAPWPVPANDRLVVPMDLKADAVLQLFDATGRLVLGMKVAAHTPQAEVSVAPLGDGVYTLRLGTADGHATARSIVVAH